MLQRTYFGHIHFLNEEFTPAYRGVKSSVLPNIFLMTIGPTPMYVHVYMQIQYSLTTNPIRPLFILIR